MGIFITAGDVYGSLEAIRAVEKRGYRPFWEFRCDCGSVVERDIYNVKKGHTRSCGCARAKANVRVRTTHGECGKNRTPEYSSWVHMRERCNRPNSPDYANYGGRGITHHDLWTDFAVFLRDMGRRPSPKYSLERRNVNGNYTPDNCYWADGNTQGRNKRSTWMIEIDNVWIPVVLRAEQLGVTPKHVRYHNRGKLKKLGDLLNENARIL